jgi:O-antigen/teichoic acid export membrane protein
MRSVMLLAFSGLLVGVLGYGGRGALAGLLGANVVAAATLGATLLARGGRFRWQLFRALVRYGAPLCPAWFADAGAKFIERAAIVQHSGLAAAGLWYLALRLADLLSSVVHAPFVQVFSVRRLELHRDGTPDREASGLISAFVAVMAWGAVALSALAPEVVRLVSRADFAPAAALVPAAAAAAAVFSLATIIEIPIYLAKRPGRITAAVAVSALVHGCLAWLCSAQWGLAGVAWARLGATCFRTGCLAVAARRLPGPRPEWWRLLGIGLLAAGCLVVHALRSFSPSRC